MEIRQNLFMEIANYRKNTIDLSRRIVKGRHLIKENRDGTGDRMSEFNTLDDVDVKNKTVLLRIDINSTIDLEENGIIGRERFRRILPTLNELKEANTVLLAHQSRPGRRDCVKLGPHREVLEGVSGRKVKYVDDLIGSAAVRAVKALKKGDLLLLENTRLYSEEIAYQGRVAEELEGSYIVRNLYPLADLFVFDAFAAAHRRQPSTAGFTGVLPSAAGRLVEEEIAALDLTLSGERGLTGVVLGGAKVEDSISVAKNLLSSGKADKILVSGLVANVFFMANGLELGRNNENFLRNKVGKLDKYVAEAKSLLYTYPYKIFIPDDVAVDAGGEREEIYIDLLPTDKMIKDIGKATMELFTEEIKACGSVILNGPSGVFEEEKFALGTEKLFAAMAEADGYTVVGGGETTTAVDRLGLRDGIDHVSTGGGATMTYLAGKEMPVLRCLEKSKGKFG